MSCCCPKSTEVQKITVEQVINMNYAPSKPSVALMLRMQQEERENNIRMRTSAVASKTAFQSDGSLATARVKHYPQIGK